VGYQSVVKCQVCATPGCENPAAYKTHSRPAWCEECLAGKLREGGLEPAGPFPGKPSLYWRTRCLTCGVEADYRFEYVLAKTAEHEAVCRACYWLEWAAASARLNGQDAGVASIDEIRGRAEAAGLDLVRTLVSDTNWGQPVVTQCRRCGRMSVERVGDLGFGCTCSRGSASSKIAAKRRGEALLFRESGSPALAWWDHDDNSEELFLTSSRLARREAAWICPNCGHHFRAKIYRMSEVPTCPACSARRSVGWQRQRAAEAVTPVSLVPALVVAWDEPGVDPSTVMIGDFRYTHWRCPKGHRSTLHPATYLHNGCPSCRGAVSRGTRTTLAQGEPEMAQQWHPTRNGERTPDTVSFDSRRQVWWRSDCCGCEWQESPFARSQLPRIRCPACGAILDSLAWQNPKLAYEWSSDNPVDAWHVRPSGASFLPRWVCASDPTHTWEAPLASRAAGAGCPECRDAGKSQIELDYHAAAAAEFGQAKSGEQLRSPAFTARGMWTVDISVLVEGIPVAIEYDGEHWHKEKQLLDERKTADLLSAGYAVVRLREDSLPMLVMSHPRLLQMRVYSGGPTAAATMKRIRQWVVNIIVTESTVNVPGFTPDNA